MAVVELKLLVLHANIVKRDISKYYSKPAYDETVRNRNLLPCRKVPCDTGNWSLVHWDIRSSRPYKFSDQEGFMFRFFELGRDSSVGIATGYELDGPGIESRWEARFSAPVQTGPGAHPCLYTMGTGSFPGVKWPGRGVDHPPHLAPRLKKE